VRGEFVGVLLMLAAALGAAGLWHVVARVLAPRPREGASPQVSASDPAPDDAGVRRPGDSVENVPAKSLSVSMFVVLLQLTFLLLVPWAVTARELAQPGVIGVALFLVPVAIGCVHAQRKGSFRW